MPVWDCDKEINLFLENARRPRKQGLMLSDEKHKFPMRFAVQKGSEFELND